MEPEPLEHRSVANLIEDLPDIREHIVICGSFNDLYHFLLPLRDKRYEEMFPIVILHPEPPTALEWAQIGHFDAVFFVRGRASDVDDLKRSGIGYASRAIILAGSGAVEDENKSSWNGQSFVEALDAETIFTFRVISQTNPHIPVLCELVVSGNISLLSSSTENGGTGEDFMYAHYAAGQVYSSSMTDILASQSFYNPHILSILSKLVSGSSSTELNEWNDKMARIVGHLEGSDLRIMPVPRDFVQKTYGEMAKWLMKQHILPMALRRGVKSALRIGENGNGYPYVYTCPDQEATLYACDSVFILANHQPNYVAHAK